MESTDANLMKNLPNFIKECEKAIKNHESNKQLTDAERIEKIQSVQNKIDNMRGTIRNLILKGSSKSK